MNLFYFASLIVYYVKLNKPLNNHPSHKFYTKSYKISKYHHAYIS